LPSAYMQTWDTETWGVFVKENGGVLLLRIDDIHSLCQEW
jgi:hypothetical protein